jgi:membrane-bound serine protease (ClpP class)
MRNAARPFRCVETRRVGRAPARGLVVLRLLSLLSLLLGLFGLAGGPVIVSAQTPLGAGPVYVAQITGEIDLGIAPYLHRVLDDAESENAAVVILEINTPGGRLDAALDMKDALLGSSVPTIAYVNRQAYSAGALIAIATNDIYMAPGAVIGAATPVVGGAGETADEKTISAVRSAFRSVAEARGLNPLIAEAMVDPSVVVPGLDGPDDLLTLTTQQAIEWDYAEAEAADMDALLTTLGLAERTLVDTSPGFAEGLVRFITNPVIASILISLGFLGLIIELQSPGFGVAGILGLLFIATFFWGHLLAGLAGFEGIALVLAGAILLGLEVFVVPGFGVAGVLGIIAFLTGIYISLIGRLPTTSDYVQALLIVTGALIVVLIGGYLSLRYFPRRSIGGIILNTRLTSLLAIAPGGVLPDETQPTIPLSLVGARGTAITDLHPAGAALIQGKRTDVVAEEGYIPAGALVQVVLDEGYRRVVTAIRLDDQQQQQQQRPQQQPANADTNRDTDPSPG